MIVPTLPLYLMDSFDASSSLVGVILSCYALSALVVRPFSGYFIDMFPRKPIYLTAYILCIFSYLGYAWATATLMILCIRIFHGMTFGMVSVAGNTIVVDILPSSRRGEGLGYFGVANNIAMATGPMTGLMLHEVTTYEISFLFSFISGIIGFIIASTVRTPYKPPLKREAISFDRFFLVKGFSAGFCVMLLAIPYGITTTYLALYGQEIGIESSVGYFFTILAAGLIASRLFAGKLVDRGYLTHVITVGTGICVLAFFLFSALHAIHLVHQDLASTLFYIVPIFLGIGYGMMFPAYNTLFVNLAPNNRRATASSTYLTSWDIGIGGGLLLGGYISDLRGALAPTFFIGAVAIMISLYWFVRHAGPHFLRNKLR